MKHGMTETRIYKTWCNMKTRCYNKNNHKYKNYGQRGITVCEEWKSDFNAFYEWATNSGYSDSLTIDRINNNGNYEPNNCRWVDLKAQANNRSTNKLITINGETHNLSEWAKIKTVNRSVIKDRIYKLGWSEEDAVLVGKMDKWDNRKGAINNR